MMPCNLIAHALQHEQKPLPALPYDPIQAVCAVSGQETACLRRKDVLGTSFTNLDRLRAPMSDFVGVDVFYAWYYGYKNAPENTDATRKKLCHTGAIPLHVIEAWEACEGSTEQAYLHDFATRYPTYQEYLPLLLAVTGKKREKRPERMSSWFCDGQTFRELDRVGVRAMVFQAEMPPVWCGYATTSYKKHGSLLAKVNTGTRRVWLFEERHVDCSDMTTVCAWWQTLNAALRAGIGRTVLESLHCPPFVLRTVGISTWLTFEAWARDKWLSALYAFLCYLLPSQDELKKERTHEPPDASIQSGGDSLRTAAPAASQQQSLWNL